MDALARAAGPEHVTAVVNVGDDVEILGLHVSPDLDTVLYTLAGLLDEERGWGVRDETTNALELAAARRRDVVHARRPRHRPPSRALAPPPGGCPALRGDAAADGAPRGRCPAPAGLPDDPVRTFLTTPAGELDFQTWFVARQHADEVTAVRYEDAEASRPAPGVLDAIAGAEVVFLAPSNPFVSVGPILAVPGIAEALAGKRVVAVSPLVGGKAVHGPAADMLVSLGYEPGVRGLAAVYAGVATDVLVDPADAGELPEALVAPIVMVAPESRADVGRAVLEAVR